MVSNTEVEWVTIQKMAHDSGYTVAALRCKIQRGDFIEGIHWRKGRDGRILFNIRAFNLWASGIDLGLQAVA